MDNTIVWAIALDLIDGSLYAAPFEKSDEDIAGQQVFGTEKECQDFIQPLDNQEGK